MQRCWLSVSTHAAFFWLTNGWLLAGLAWELIVGNAGAVGKDRRTKTAAGVAPSFNRHFQRELPPYAVVALDPPAAAGSMYDIIPNTSLSAKAPTESHSFPHVLPAPVCVVLLRLS